jgi:transcriptional regulator with XRE-family HTH domain
MGSPSDKIVLIELGRRIKRERLSQNLGQETLAILSGLQTYQISRAENGDLDLASTSLIKIIWALKVEPGAIIPTDFDGEEIL